MRTLQLVLEARGFRCWLDQTETTITTDGMKDGIAKADVFLLFLRSFVCQSFPLLHSDCLLVAYLWDLISQGAMSRPFVHLEIREALRLKKKIILCHEQVRQTTRCQSSNAFFLLAEG